VVEQLQKILPDMAIGSDTHQATMNAIKSLSRFASPQQSDPGNQTVQLRQLMQQAGKDQMTQQVMRNLGAGTMGAGQTPLAGAAGAGAPTGGASPVSPASPMGGMT